MMEDMKNRGVIEESKSPWPSPVVLVRKKNGDLRFRMDYRKLNDVTKKVCFPLPKIDDTFNTLAGAKWLSTLYLKADIGRWSCILTKMKRRRFPQVKGYGSSRLCPLAFVMPQQHLNG
jgi:hypothetical protein